MRSDSVNNEVDNLADALNDLPIPREAGGLTRVQRRLYQAYGRGKATKDWFDHELVMLADLCRVTDLLSKERRTLKREGMVVNGRLGPITNPRIAAVKTMSAQQLQMLRTLGLSSAQTMTKRQIVHRAGKAKDARSKLRTTARPSLLAVPDR